jgi:hypothetical protein
MWEDKVLNPTARKIPVKASYQLQLWGERF